MQFSSIYLTALPAVDVPSPECLPALDLTSALPDIDDDAPSCLSHGALMTCSLPISSRLSLLPSPPTRRALLRLLMLQIVIANAHRSRPLLAGTQRPTVHRDCLDRHIHADVHCGASFGCPGGCAGRATSRQAPSLPALRDPVGGLFAIAEH